MRMSVYKLWKERGMVSFPDELWHGAGLLPGRFRGWCRGAVRLSGNPGARSALSALSHGLPEKEQRSARPPGAQHQSCRRPEKKGASVHSPNSKAPLQAQRPRRRGRGSRECAWTVWAVRPRAPRRDKRASVLERRPPRAWWQHKGKLCPRGTQGHLCLPSPSQRKVTEGASRLSSLLRDLVTGMAKLFLQDAGNSDENSNMLAC